MLRILAIALLSCLSFQAAADDWPQFVEGKPSRIVDGDTIHLDGFKIRLLGIDTPEMKQYCDDDKGVPWPCGVRARDMLVGLIHAGGNVSCQITGRDRYKRLLGRCFAGDIDVQHALIAAGFGVAEYTPDYRDVERDARRHKIGMWSGEFDRPRTFRRNQ